MGPRGVVWFLLGSGFGLGCLCLALGFLCFALGFLFCLRLLLCCLRVDNRFTAGVGVLVKVLEDILIREGGNAQIQSVLNDSCAFGSDILGDELGLGTQANALGGVVDFKVGHIIDPEGAAGGNLFPGLDNHAGSIAFAILFIVLQPGIHCHSNKFLFGNVQSLKDLSLSGLGLDRLYVLFGLGGFLGHCGSLLLGNILGGLGCGSVLGVLCGNAHF